MLIIGGSGSGKTNSLFNIIKEQKNDELIDKIYLYAKNLNELKYKLLIEKREDPEIKHLNDPKTFLEYSNTRTMFTIILITVIQKEAERF